MASVQLSAPLIVRNEERFLPACLGSLRDVVDEIVVVDTGSTDRTREIARDFGACVHELAWADDFAAARNHALDLARGQWILYVDADERLRSGSLARLRAQLDDASHVGFQVLLHPRAGFTPYWELRLFRNHPLIRFKGVIHENIWPGIDAYRRAHGGRIGRSDLALDHEGYEGDQASKHERNLPLLERAVQDDPTRVYLWCHLASIHAARGDAAGAEQAWTRALELSRRRAWPLPEDALPYVGLIQWRGSRAEDVDRLLDEAMVRFRDNLQLVWLCGRTHMARGRFAEAIPHFERLVQCGETGEHDRSTAYDRRLFGVLSYDSLATCHFRLGHWATSRRYFELAAAEAPERLEYRVKQALCARYEASRSTAS
jgi:glycosyltransferase involved in cell wall biosynthesis